MAVHDVHVEPVRSLRDHPRHVPREVTLVRGQQRRAHGGARARGGVPETVCPRRGIDALRGLALPSDELLRRGVRRFVRGVRLRVQRVQLGSRHDHSLLVHHRVDRGEHIAAVRSRGDGGEDSGAERRGVGAFGSLERDPRDVRVDLQPEVRSRRAPGDDDGGGEVSVRAHRVEDEPRAEGDSLQDGTVHVRPPVSQRETGDDAARQRVHVRGSIPLQVLLHHEALAPGRDQRRGGVDLVVETLAPAAHRLEPVHHRARRRLSSLDHVAAFPDQRAGVRAPYPPAVELALGHPEVEVRGAGDERELTGSNGPEADHRDESVGAALRHRNAGVEAQVRRGRLRQRRHRVAHLHDVLRPLLRELRHAELREQGRRGFAVDEVPSHGDVVRGRAVPPGELEVDVILVLAHLRGAGEELGPVLLEPERLRDHPLGADGPGSVAVDAERDVAGGEHLLGLLRGAHVHPQDTRHERVARVVQRDHGATRGVAADSRHVSGGDAGVREHLANGRSHPDPPVVRILLRPSGLGVPGLVGGIGESDGFTRGDLEETRADAAGSAIHADHVLRHWITRHEFVMTGSADASRSILSSVASPGEVC